MRRVLDLFSEQGTIDEMGLGTLRDALSDALFPGTSSIQTRLRYVLFIPWIYQRLAARYRRGGTLDIARDAREAEISLIKPLLANADSDGVIGALAGAKLSRLPTHIYWAALVRWGLFLRGQGQAWFHARFASLAPGTGDVFRADDPGVVWARQPVWHPRLPTAPKDFPDEVSFSLTHDEAVFLQGRLEERCGGSLLAWLAREGSDRPSEAFWDDPDVLRPAGDISDTVELARRFSLHVEGLPLLYNLLLGVRRHELQGKDTELIERYQAELGEGAEREAAERAFDPHVLWSFMARRGARLVESQRRFVERWSSRLREIGPAAVAEEAALHTLVQHRELALKGPRARFANQGRLLDWSGRVGVGRMDFRWFRVRQLLEDLHAGLAT